MSASPDGSQVPELWNDYGDTFVYLYPQNTGRQASFRVDSTIFASSPPLAFMARGQNAAVQRQAARDVSPPYDLLSPTSVTPELSGNDRAGSARNSRDFLQEEARQELHLYLPVPLKGDLSHISLLEEDIEMLVLFRNFVAFLVGQSLVATPRCDSLFSIFLEVSGLLGRFEFSNLDGSTFGEAASCSFANYCEELQLTD